MRYLKIDKIKIVNNKIFGIGDGGIFTMNDDLTWNSHLSFWNKLNDQYSPFYPDITYGNGKYVAIGWESGNEDSFTVSEDGEDWDYVNVGKLFTGKFWGITYGMGIFVAVGSYGYIFVSEDGINWSPANFVDRITLKDVIFANNTFVAVSWDPVDNKGRILKKMELGSEGYFDIKIQSVISTTAFEKYGNFLIFILFVVLLIFFCLIEFLFSIKRKH